MGEWEVIGEGWEGIDWWLNEYLTQVLMTVMVEVDKDSQVYSIKSNGIKHTDFCPGFIY